MFLVFDYCNEKSTLCWGAHWSVGLTGFTIKATNTCKAKVVISFQPLRLCQ